MAMNPVCDVQSRQSQVTEQIELLSARLSQLESTAGQLEPRFGKVLRPLEPAVAPSCGNGKVSVALVDLADTLAVQSRRVGDVISLLESIHARCEL